MADSVTKLPISKEAKNAETAVTAPEWRPFELLRREVDQLFDDFGVGFWRSPFRRALSAEPFWRREAVWNAAPAVDITETERGLQYLGRVTRHR